MNRLGMMIGLSHVSHQTKLDIFETTKAPVIFSHSSVHTICDHPRNVRYFEIIIFFLRKLKGQILI